VRAAGGRLRLKLCKNLGHEETVARRCRVTGHGNNSEESKSTDHVVTVGGWLRRQKKAAGDAAANKHTRQSLGTLTCFIMLSKLVSDENPGVPYDDFRFPAEAFRICLLPYLPGGAVV
jgi:hypothetical protein